jgi:hypothetical protein
MSAGSTAALASLVKTSHAENAAGASFRTGGNGSQVMAELFSLLG